MDINMIPAMERVSTFAEKITLLSQQTAVIHVPLRLENIPTRCKIMWPSHYDIKTSPSRGCHFAGFHSCLVLTIARPVVCHNLQIVSQMLPQVPGFGYLTWACPVTHKRGHNDKILYTNIPNIIWHKNPVGKADYLNTVGYLSNLTITYPYSNGTVASYTFSIIQIPSINREHFGPQSINHEWKPSDKRK